jgi:hypothetical protein
MELVDYVRASREKWRFPSNKGSIDLEQLWDAPLTHKNGFSLDNIARTIQSHLNEMGPESFVPNVAVNPNYKLYQRMLEIVKYVISVRVQESDAQRLRAERAEKRNAILLAIRNKQEAQLANSSLDELLGQLAALDE